MGIAFNLGVTYLYYVADAWLRPHTTFIVVAKKGRVAANGVAHKLTNSNVTHSTASTTAK
eukprot:7266237-Lingulodinium_polyedra.AAC.1